MKITDIKTYPIWVGIRNQLIVKVETDEGIVGWSESGLGVEFNEERAQHSGFRYWEAPHLRRRDGSVTNW